MVEGQTGKTQVGSGAVVPFPLPALLSASRQTAEQAGSEAEGMLKSVGVARGVVQAR